MESIYQEQSSLNKIKEKLESSYCDFSDYHIPDIWLNFLSAQPHTVSVNPYSFYIERIAEMMALPKESLFSKKCSGNWSQNAITYNLFVRHGTSWDHDNNGRLGTNLIERGWRETGTFLKAIALLPYIRWLGCNTIHLLPINCIGNVNRKGRLGSPYAIRNHYVLDENLSEPVLGLGVEEEFKAFVEAAHHLGIRVVMEMVFRTMAIDADLVMEHPDWFYWIYKNIANRPDHVHDETKYGQPFFSAEELELIHSKILSKEYDNLIPPHKIYRDMFTAPPGRNTLHKEEDGWVGILSDSQEVRIPHASVDWPFSTFQPPWLDITYLKFHLHSNYNYISYNTIRMTCKELCNSEYVNLPLWKYLCNVVLFYQKKYYIDGVMLDMGHSIPDGLKAMISKNARVYDPEFALWIEDFDPIENKRDESVNAIMRIPFVQDFSLLKQFIESYLTISSCMVFMATGENHNTSRVASRPGGIKLARICSAIISILPCMPWIHNGFELCDQHPINPVVYKYGIDDDLDCELLFSGDKPLDWTSNNRIVEIVKKVLKFRRLNQDILCQVSASSILYNEVGPVKVIIRNAANGEPKVTLIINSDWEERIKVKVHLPVRNKVLKDFISESRVDVDSNGFLALDLDPGEFRLYRIE